MCKKEVCSEVRPQRTVSSLISCTRSSFHDLSNKVQGCLEVMDFYLNFQSTTKVCISKDTYKFGCIPGSYCATFRLMKLYLIANGVPNPSHDIYNDEMLVVLLGLLFEIALEYLQVLNEGCFGMWFHYKLINNMLESLIKIKELQLYFC